MDTETIIRAVLSLALVVGLIGMAAILYKKYFLDKNLMNKGTPKKLKIEEVLYLDSKRKLVLISNEGKETLLLLSPNAETIIK
jgi:flagellar biogenesis protein FliO